MNRILDPITEIPVKINCEIRSGSYYTFEIDLTSETGFKVLRENNTHYLKSEEFLVSADAEVDSWKRADSFLATLCLLHNGVFSRILWKKRAAFEGIEFVRRGYSPFGSGASVFTAEDFIPLTDKTLYLQAYQKIFDRITQDQQAYCILVYYATSNWFYLSNLVREAGINYFTVVEAITKTQLPSHPAKAIYNLGDIKDAADKLCVDAIDWSKIDKAHKTRGALAHGNPDSLLLAQHTHGSNPVSSASIWKPADECKTAADIFLKKYFRI